MNSNRNIYMIYANKDKALAHRILKLLEPLEKDSNCTIWSDDIIYENQEWKPKANSRVQETDVFVLLVSNSFMYSKFIEQAEFKMVIDSYKEGTSTVIPVLLDACPWDTEFNSEEYNFSFKELDVLPDNRTPLSEHNNEQKALQQIAEQLGQIINPSAKKNVVHHTDQLEEKKIDEPPKEEQIALNFSEEHEKESSDVEENGRLKDSENKKKAAQEEQDKKAAEKSAELALQAKKDAAAQKLALEKQAAEAKEKERLKQLTLEQERAAREKNDIAENFNDEATDYSEAFDDEAVIAAAKDNEKLKNRALIGIGIALLAFGIWFFSGSDTTPEKPDLPDVTEEVVIEPIKTESEEEIAKEPVTVIKRNVGDRFEGGIIFKVNADGTSGTMTSYDDAGRMSWNDAMNIHEELGAGWRLPSLDELKLMRNTIGQGADNDGEFSDGLYWSATDYDEYQARLLRFRDGNTSYHYNKAIESRKFRVRAVRDFN